MVLWTRITITYLLLNLISAVSFGGVTNVLVSRAGYAHPRPDGVSRAVFTNSVYTNLDLLVYGQVDTNTLVDFSLGKNNMILTNGAALKLNGTTDYSPGKVVIDSEDYWIKCRARFVATNGYQMTGQVDNDNDNAWSWGVTNGVWHRDYGTNGGASGATADTDWHVFEDKPGDGLYIDGGLEISDAGFSGTIQTDGLTFPIGALLNHNSGSSPTYSLYANIVFDWFEIWEGSTLIASYGFEEEDGGWIHDRTGNGNHVEFSLASLSASWGEKQHLTHDNFSNGCSKAVHFNRANTSYIDLPETFGLGSGTSVVWQFTVQEEFNDNHVFFGSGTNSLWYLQCIRMEPYYTDDRPLIRIGWDDDSLSTWQTDADFADYIQMTNVTRTYGFTVGATHTTLYIDGVANTNTKWSGGATLKINSFGKTEGGTGYKTPGGVLTRMMLVDAELSAAEHLTIHQGGTHASALFDYQCKNLRGDDLPDSEGGDPAVMAAACSDYYIPALLDKSDDSLGVGLTNPGGMAHNGSDSELVPSGGVSLSNDLWTSGGAYRARNYEEIMDNTDPATTVISNDCLITEIRVNE